LQRYKKFIIILSAYCINCTGTYYFFQIRLQIGKYNVNLQIVKDCVIEVYSTSANGRSRERVEKRKKEFRSSGVQTNVFNHEIQQERPLS